MKIYISTPINARKEKTFAEKYNAAKECVEDCILELQKNSEWSEERPNAEYVSTFDINPLGDITEAEAMGKCIQAVMECDAFVIALPKGIEKYESKGVLLEERAAELYGKEIFCYGDITEEKWKIISIYKVR